MTMIKLDTSSCPSSMQPGYLLYARKSSEGEDKQAASIDDQLTILRRLATERNLTIRKEFTESMSAKAPGRPVFGEMLVHIKEQSVKGIICWKVDRLFRNPMDEGTIRWMLQSGSIEEIVTPSKIYLEADSDFLMAVEGAQAQRFIKDLRANTLRGVQRKLDNGIAPVLAPPGYRNAVEKPQGLRDIEPHPTQFSLMRKLFDYALTGTFTIYELYEKAYVFGVRNNRNQPISRTRFYVLLQDPVFYTGKFRYKDMLHQGTHKRMITDVEHETVRSRYAPHTTPRIADVTGQYNGLLKCICGHFMTSERHAKHYKNGTSQTFTYYRCVHHKEGKPSYINLKSLDAQILSYLSSVALKQHYVDLFIEWLNEKNGQQRDFRDARRQEYQRQLTDIEVKLENLMALFISPHNNNQTLITDEEYKRRRQSLLIEKHAIKEKLDRLDDETDEWMNLTAKSFQFATSAVEKFTNGSREEKRAILRAFGSNLVVNGKRLEITVRTPFELIQRYAVDESLIVPTDRPTRLTKLALTPPHQLYG